MKRLFSAVTFLAIALPACTICRCGSALQFLAAEPARVVHVKVVADPSFAGHSRWRTNAENLIGTASELFMGWFDIAFEIDTMVVWDLTNAPCHTTMFDWHCLVKSVDKGSSDVVIHFSKETDPYRFRLAGISLYTFGYIQVIQAGWVHKQGGYEEAFLTLVHELGHLFGGIHVYHDQKVKTRYILNPRLSPKLIQRTGTEIALALPDFHPGNVSIIRGLLNRPFDPAGWGAEHLVPVQSAYAEARREWCPFRVGSGGELSREHEDQLHEISYYYFLSNWAALSGEDSVALAYVDSAEALIEAVKHTCTGCGLNCQRRVCLHSGTRESRIARWYQRRKAGLHYWKAYVLLHCGRPVEAEHHFEQFFSLHKDMRLTYVEKHRAGFEFYREWLCAEPEETGNGREGPCIPLPEPQQYDIKDQ